MGKQLCVPEGLKRAYFADLADERLVQLCQNGEEMAFHELVRRHRGRIYALSVSILKDAAEADEAVQEALLRAYQRLGSFEQRASFSTWLYAIARNECLQRRRKKRPAPGGQDAMDAAATRSELSSAPPPGPMSSAVARELCSATLRALGRLAPESREALLALAVDGEPLTSIAGEQGVSVAALKSRMHRARTRIREDVTSELGPMAATI